MSRTADCVYIVYHTGASTAASGRCGKTDVTINQSTGAITGPIVHMWETQASGGDCTATMVNLVAHEIDHVLGLGDVDTDPACARTIMGGNPSYVTTDQCTAVETAWYTPAEKQADTDYDMNTCNTWCVLRCEYDWNSLVLPARWRIADPLRFE
jgi:hypothetical protein